MNRLLVIVAITLSSCSAFADEGMSTFNKFPSSRVGQAYGFAPDQGWLVHLRMSSLRIAGGSSASLVSAEGLVMTNHHCARECIETMQR